MVIVIFTLIYSLGLSTQTQNNAIAHTLTQTYTPTRTYSQIFVILFTFNLTTVTRILLKSHPHTDIYIPNHTQSRTYIQIYTYTHGVHKQ